MIVLTSPELKSIALTHKECAEKLGVSEQYLCDVLKGRRRLSANLAARLEQFDIPAGKRFLQQAEEDLEHARRSHDQHKGERV